MRKYMGSAAAGFCAGAVAGLFGAGGGMVLIPLLTALTSMDANEVFPSSVTIILPICVVTLIATAMQQPVDWLGAVPYLIGSALGGFFAGKWGQKIPVTWLHRGLGILILWGGVRYLC